MKNIYQEQNSQSQAQLYDFLQKKDYEKISSIFYNYNEMLILEFQDQQKLNISKKINFQTASKWFSLQNHNNLYQLKQLKISCINLQKFPLLQAPMLKDFKLTFTKTKYLNQFLKGNYPSLQVVNITDQLIQSLQKLNAPQLRQLHLNQNRKLENIEEFANESYSMLKKLVIFESKIRKLPRLKAIKLQQISMRSNKIQRIDQFSTGDHPELKLINFYGNFIKQIPSFKFPKLEDLHLGSNKIVDLTQFSKAVYDNLITLNLSDNKKIQEIPQLKTPNLMTIILTGCKIVEIRQFAKGKYYNLTKIQLQNNLISYFPQVNSNSLSYLSLSNNKLSHLNFSSKNNKIQFNNVSFLNVSQNKVMQIPNILCSTEFTQLLQLSLRQNEISNIQLLSEIKLSTLQKLNLCENHITKLKSFKKLILPSIKVLDLSLNKFSEISEFYKIQNISDIINSPVKKNFNLFLYESLQQLCLFEDTIDMAKYAPASFCEIKCLFKLKTTNYKIQIFPKGNENIRNFGDIIIKKEIQSKQIHQNNGTNQTNENRQNRQNMGKDCQFFQCFLGDQTIYNVNSIFKSKMKEKWNKNCWIVFL